MKPSSLLIAKNDLKLYPKKSLNLLARHYGINVKDRDELCWLLAIKIQESLKSSHNSMPTGEARDRLLQWARDNGVEREIQKVLDGHNRLDLSSKGLTEIPPELGMLTNLQVLWLDRNQLSELPAEIGMLTNLQHLVLSTNNLAYIPAEIGMLTNLQQLDLSTNNLAYIPAELGMLTNLQELWLGGNHLTQIPPELFTLTNLQSLNLDNNQFEEIPTEIGMLTNLKYLHLTGNQLTEIPAELGGLPHLQGLWLIGNPLIEKVNLTTLREQWESRPRFKFALKTMPTGEDRERLLQ